MQFFVVLLIIAVASVHGQVGIEKKEDKLLGSAYGSGGGGASAYSAPAAPSYAAPAAPSYAAPAAPAYAAPAQSYQPVSIPSPPCPKNYLFSCQPNLQPVPCARAASGGYGSQGAYSEYLPTYALPTGYVY